MSSPHITNVYNNLLFLGSQYGSRENLLRQRNIKTIVSIGCLPLLNNEKYGADIHTYDIEDDGRNVEYFFRYIIPEIHATINDCLRNNQPILVHCQAGMSRSATAIITWFMKYQGMQYENAHALVKKYRSIISPNPYFTEYMKTCFN